MAQQFFDLAFDHHSAFELELCDPAFVDLRLFPLPDGGTESFLVIIDAMPRQFLVSKETRAPIFPWCGDRSAIPSRQ